MGILKRLPALLALAGVPMVAGAQGEAAPQPYAYSTYFYCDVKTQERASELMKSVSAPAYDAAVKDGRLIAWGWLAHHTGGKWRRALYMVAPTLEGVFAAQDSIGEVLDKNKKASDEFASICHSHDDYVWQQQLGTRIENRGNIGFSVYFECDISKEDRADRVVRDVIAPVYNRHLGDGKLSSWGWLTHVIGGKYRRLATMTAGDLNTLLRERASILEELIASGDADEFNEICNSHQDYIWEIELETP